MECFLPFCACVYRLQAVLQVDDVRASLDIDFLDVSCVAGLLMQHVDTQRMSIIVCLCMNQ